MRITGLYAALLALLILGLAARVMWLRRRTRIGLGDGGDRAVACAVRSHGNATEYVPLALILLLVLELNQTLPVLLHAFGIVLLLARIAHAIGLSGTPGYSAGRATGAAITLLVIALMALMLLWQYAVIHLLV
ncbi:putative membrane protein YecN with MAPEG domain [Luteibacter jiangsuensis]|uniref:Membrane protein YecN with MAPEG domain n=1 Tax=Luteibacter jiangsuensis TaxID=637577 RepID=A0ABT9T5A0_9GAMM|nr:MAPEG family protein [Luteibacter jiangsuensis]MDQ0011347.1 putative membrane protein YecN with MAPEG domain [Luteibacter jiangsuensis]